MKIFFVCNWEESSYDLKSRMDKMTTKNNGIWGNIKSTNNINETDFVIALNNIPKNFHFNSNKIIILPREPSIIYKNNTKLKHSYSYSNIYHVVTEPQFLQLNYDYLINLKYPEKTNLISSITSMKLHTPLAKKRVEFITKFCKNHPNIMEVFGNKWDNRLNKDYKGALGYYHNNNNKSTTKYHGLKKYKYSLCIENSIEPNYFSEKFTDCILSWTIPIYYGCPNIDKYFPKNSFYKLDNLDSTQQLISIINKPITQKNITDLSLARTLILNKYNIWSTLEAILKNNT